MAAPALVGGGTFAIMCATALANGLPVHDPESGVLGSPLNLVVAVLALFIGLDVIPRAVYRARSAVGSLPRTVTAVYRERWSRRRLTSVVIALVGFYLAYLGYRNLKSFLPTLRASNYDHQLLQLDRDMSFGHDPGVLLHDILGSGISAHVLSFVYIGFLLFVPLSLGAAVVWHHRLHRGLWYVTSMNLAWLIGVASYYMLPSLGPAFSAPQNFAGLPSTGVSQLQESLLDHRAQIVAAPNTTDGVQSIAAFASLHVAIVLAAALIAQLLHLARGIRIFLWTWLLLTLLATIYFGWHYIVDDLAGALIGLAAVVLGAKATGHPLRGEAPAPEMAFRRGDAPAGAVS